LFWSVCGDNVAHFAHIGGALFGFIFNKSMGLTADPVIFVKTKAATGINCVSENN